MRSVGDASWLNDYIGLPYELGGRGPCNYDCYGLCKVIYQDVFDVTLPDWQEDVLELRCRAKAIADVVTSGEWTDLDEPVDGCFVICYRNKAAHHIGLYFAGGVVHAIDGSGVVFEPLSRFASRFSKIEFGEWQP